MEGSDFELWLQMGGCVVDSCEIGGTRGIRKEYVGQRQKELAN